MAIVVFGFAIGRFAIAIRQFMQIQGHSFRTTGLTVWFGAIAIFGGVLLTLAGLLRYRRTRDQLESGRFEPAGFLVDLVGILVALFGLALASYLLYNPIAILENVSGFLISIFAGKFKLFPG